MERASLALCIAAALSVQPRAALAAKATVVLYNDGNLARPAETVVIPFAAVKKALPDLMFDQVDRARRQGVGHPIASHRDETCTTKAPPNTTT